MISPSPPEFHPAPLEVVSRSIRNPVRLLISYCLLRSSAIRVFLILFAEIPYFSQEYGNQLNLLRFFVKVSGCLEARS